jgi:hypothetical protein
MTGNSKGLAHESNGNVRASLSASIAAATATKGKGFAVTTVTSNGVVAERANVAALFSTLRLLGILYAVSAREKQDEGKSGCTAATVRDAVHTEDSSIRTFGQ